MQHEDFIGTSTAARTLERDVHDAAASDAKVLLIGESGVGKEVAARLIHEGSPRRRSELVALNCAAVPDSLLESELFGHVRGSFTGAYRDKPGLLETANGGTIFLDEIGETSLRMQALLLRFLENGEIWRIGADRVRATSNVRVIAATNRDLRERIRQGHFREDLFYRLNVLQITVPPLRARRDDIPLFISHFLNRYCRRHNLPVPELAPDTMAALVAYDWPGNVRELKNIIERLVVRNHAARIRVADLPPEVMGSERRASASDESTPSAPSRVDELYDAMTLRGQSFWSAVHPLFMARDMVRDDLRAIVSRGLTQTRGSYRLLLQLFNMPPEDYKAFLSFLRKHQCHVPFFRFRCLTLPADRVTGAAAPAAKNLVVAEKAG